MPGRAHAESWDGLVLLGPLVFAIGIAATLPIWETLQVDREPRLPTLCGCATKLPRRHGQRSLTQHELQEVQLLHSVGEPAPDRQGQHVGAGVKGCHVARGTRCGL
jgi:hypothetical protein